MRQSLVFRLEDFHIQTGEITRFLKVHQLFESNARFKKDTEDCDVAGAEKSFGVECGQDGLLLLNREGVKLGPNERWTLDVLKAIALSPSFLVQPAGEGLQALKIGSDRVVRETFSPHVSQKFMPSGVMDITNCGVRAKEIAYARERSLIAPARFGGLLSPLLCEKLRDWTAFDSFPAGSHDLFPKKLVIMIHISPAPPSRLRFHCDNTVQSWVLPARQVRAGTPVAAKTREKYGGSRIFLGRTDLSSDSITESLILRSKKGLTALHGFILERKTRFELATFSLARRRATTAPLPRVRFRKYIGASREFNLQGDEDDQGAEIAGSQSGDSGLDRGPFDSGGRPEFLSCYEVSFAKGFVDLGLAVVEDLILELQAAVGVCGPEPRRSPLCPGAHQVLRRVPSP